MIFKPATYIYQYQASFIVLGYLNISSIREAHRLETINTATQVVYCSNVNLFEHQAVFIGYCQLLQQTLKPCLGAIKHGK